MPKYTNTLGKIDLNDYKRVKDLTTGRTNQVSLWEHKQDSSLQIVVKIPNGINPDLIAHNLRSINAFFGEDSAWPIEGKIGGKEGFAMKYFEGMPLSPKEEAELIDKTDTPLKTISKNGLVFTILDPNKDNFLKLPTGEFIPIDFDYMIIHDRTPLLPYQQMFLNGRQGYYGRIGDCSTEEATRYVLDDYPAAKSYLYEIWGHEFCQTPARQQLETPCPEDTNFKQEILKTLELYQTKKIPNVVNQTEAKRQFGIVFNQVKARLENLSSNPSDKNEVDNIKIFIAQLEIAMNNPNQETKEDCLKKANDAIGDYHWGPIVLGAFIVILGLIASVATLVACPIFIPEAFDCVSYGATLIENSKKSESTKNLLSLFFKPLEISDRGLELSSESSFEFN